MHFAQPIFLWALAGLGIPIAIHLLSRKEGKVIKMGSLRHLQETSTQQFKGIKLNEILLLALRSLLVVLFVFLISGAYWKQNNQKWLVVEKGLEVNASAKKLADSLLRQGFEWHWLETGFPLQEAKPVKNTHSNWELISLLKSQDLDQIIVLSTSRLKDFHGKRESFNGNIQWITFPDAATNFFTEAIPQEINQVSIRKGHSQEDYTNFETVLSNNLSSDSLKLVPPKTIRAVIISDPKFEQERTLLKAALLAISKTLPVIISITEEPSPRLFSQSDWVFWLSGANVPKNDSINLITYQVQFSNQLIDQIGKNSWNINKTLTLDVARENNFTLQLASLLIDEKEKWDKISHNDRRVLPDSILSKGSHRGSDTLSASVSPPPSKWILLALLFVLLCERVISYQRNQ